MGVVHLPLWATWPTPYLGLSYYASSNCGYRCIVKLYLKNCANRYHRLEGAGQNLWSVLVWFNALKGFPSGPCWRGNFLVRKTDFVATSAIKQQRWLCDIWRGEALVEVGGVRRWRYDSEDVGGGYWQKKKLWGIWRRWTRFEKREASGWSLLRYWSSSCYVNCLYC